MYCTVPEKKEAARDIIYKSILHVLFCTTLAQKSWNFVCLRSMFGEEGGLSGNSSSPPIDACYE